MNITKISSRILGMTVLGAALATPVFANAAVRQDSAHQQATLANSWDSVPRDVRYIAQSVSRLYDIGSRQPEEIASITRSNNTYTFQIQSGFRQLDPNPRTPDGSVYNPGKSASMLQFRVNGNTDQVADLTAFDAQNHTAWHETAIPVQYRHITLKGASSSWSGTFDVDVAQAKKPGTTFMDQYTESGFSLSYHPTDNHKQVNVKYNVFLPLVGGTGPKGVTTTTDANGNISSTGSSDAVGWYTDEGSLNTTTNILTAANPTAQVTVTWNGQTQTFNLVK